MTWLKAGDHHSCHAAAETQFETAFSGHGCEKLRRSFRSAPTVYADTMLSDEALGKRRIIHATSVGSLVRKNKSGRPAGVEDDMTLVGILSDHLMMEQLTNHV
jgi:hypothetical protein